VSTEIGALTAARRGPIIGLMKDTFDRLPEEKREKVIEACVAEFAEQGYEAGSTDRICKACGISKGGLYEYIDAKEELFVCAVERVYARLYGYIQGALARSRRGTPPDILDRFERVSGIAIDFYIEHPLYIKLIQMANQVADHDLKARANAVFRKRFLEVFGDVDGSALRFPAGQVIELVGWLLLKTRDDFLSAAAKGGTHASLKRAYMKEWAFYLDALRRGIYRPGMD
jgi:AcrR family transcriptional regulator